MDSLQDLTDDQIDALSAGHELDVLVHQAVFGKRVQLIKGGKPYAWDKSGNPTLFTKDRYIDPDDKTMYLHATDGYQGMLPEYSTRIGDAWRIVNHLWDIHLMYFHLDYHESLYFVHFSSGDNIFHGAGNTASLAICRAALKAVRDK